VTDKPVDGRLFEEIHYALSYNGESYETEYAIIRALSRLPDDVREFALWRCRFISTDGLRGTFLPGSIGVDALTRRSRGVWLIILHLDGLTPESAESVVAHELAHLWLGHEPFEPGDSDAELEAAAQTRAWGFRGSGTRPSWLPHNAKNEASGHLSGTGHD
jgi:hypothetical protein